MNSTRLPQPNSILATAWMSRRDTAGFTLIELMVAIAIIGILASLAAPSFSGLIASQRAKGVATDLHVALIKARSEATKRNANVTLSPNTGGWQNGWQIYPTATATNILDNHAATNGVAISAAISGGATTVVYQNSGRVQGTVSFDITASSGSASSHRCVSVGLSGLPSVKASSC